MERWWTSGKWPKEWRRVISKCLQVEANQKSSDSCTKWGKARELKWTDNSVRRVVGSGLKMAAIVYKEELDLPIQAHELTYHERIWKCISPGWSYGSTPEGDKYNWGLGWDEMPYWKSKGKIKVFILNSKTLPPAPFSIQLPECWLPDVWSSPGKILEDSNVDKKEGKSSGILNKNVSWFEDTKDCVS